LQNVMFLTSENNQYRYNRLKGGTNAKCSPRCFMVGRQGVLEA
jgi:hypothetical protein